MIILLDILLLILISVCIFYCWILNKRIKDLQDSKEVFRDIGKNFNTVVSSAGQSINKLHEISNSTTKNLAQTINKAENINNDLSFINEVCNNTADRLEKKIEVLRTEEKRMDDNVIEDSKENTERNHNNYVKPESMSTNMKYDNNDTQGYYNTLRKISTKKL